MNPADRLWRRPHQPDRLRRPHTPTGGRVLREKLADRLNRLIEGMCAQVGASRDRILDVVAVGNTVMHHLFAGLPVRTLGAAPYRPLTTDALDLVRPRRRARASGGHARLHSVEHRRLRRRGSRRRAAVDRGRGDAPAPRSPSTSAPTPRSASPAAGGSSLLVPLRPGLRGRAHHAPGCGPRPAPSSACASADRRLDVHDRAPATRRHLRLRDPGRGGRNAARRAHRPARQLPRGGTRASAPASGPAEFLLVPAAETGHRRDIMVTRGDVNEIQLAKAAIRAGIDVLLQEAECEPGELEEIVVAGAFGSYLDLSSAVRVGLAARIPLERFRQVGNAAGAGARQMLLSAESAPRRAGDRPPRRVRGAGGASGVPPPFRHRDGASRTEDGLTATVTTTFPVVPRPGERAVRVGKTLEGNRGPRIGRMRPVLPEREDFARPRAGARPCGPAGARG